MNPFPILLNVYTMTPRIPRRLVFGFLGVDGRFPCGYKFRPVLFVISMLKLQQQFWTVWTAYAVSNLFGKFLWHLTRNSGPSQLGGQFAGFTFGQGILRGGFGQGVEGIRREKWGSKVHRVSTAFPWGKELSRCGHISRSCEISYIPR